MTKQRGNSEGSIYQRGSRGGEAGDGRWAASLKDNAGKRIVIYAKTRKEVAEKLRAKLDKRDQGMLLGNRRQTLQAFMTTWLRDTVKPTVAPATYRSYAGLMQNHILPALGALHLDEVTVQHVQRLLNSASAHRSSKAGKVNRPASAQTVSLIRATLRAALNHAIESRLLSWNAAVHAKLPKGEEYQHLAFTREEAARFLEAIQGEPLEAMYVLAVSTGLRQGELLGLTWKDVIDAEGVRIDVKDPEFAASFLRVREQLQRIDGRLRRVPLKSRSSKRDVALIPDAVMALRSRAAIQRAEKLAHRDRWKETGLVFTTPIGTPLEGTNVTKAFQKILRTAQLPERRFHDLRHSTATLLLIQGVSYKVVASILGHSSTKLTLDTYSHVVPELQREAAEKMQAVLQR